MYLRGEFTLVGDNVLLRYRISGTYLILEEMHYISETDLEQQFDASESPATSSYKITSLIYYYYLLGSEVDYDYILGTSEGHLSIFTFGKYKVIRRDAHEGAINVLKLVDVFSKSSKILTAGHDQKIKIWDSKLEFVNQIDLQ